MDASLRRLADRLEIRDLVTRYFNSADRRDFHALVECFVPGTLVDYSDRLVRTTDGWRIEHRRAVRDIALALPPRTPATWKDAPT